VGALTLRHQFVLDKRTNKLLEELALQLYADMEDRLEKIEADPAFQEMMAESGKAIRQGRVTPHREVVRMSRARSKKRK